MNAGRKFKIGAMSSFRLAGNRAGDQTPVHFREDDIHGEIGGAKAARVFPPLRLCRTGKNRLQDRRIGAVENACFVIEPGRKAGRIDDDIGFIAGEFGANKGDGFRVLEARNEDRGDFEPARGECVRERANWRRVAGKHQGTVEDDERLALGVDRAYGSRPQNGPPPEWPSGLCWFPPRERRARAALDEIEKRRDVFRPAVLEGGVNMAEINGGDCRGGVEPCIFHRVARHDGEREILRPRRAGKFLDAVAPIVKTAEKTDQDKARLARGLLDIEIDRIGVFERAEIGEPQAHGVVRAPLRGGRDEAEIAVGKGEKQEIGRGLSKINGGLGLVERSRAPCAGDASTQAPSLASSRPIDALSSPFSPMTTRRPRRGSPRRQGRSKFF